MLTAALLSLLASQIRPSDAQELSFDVNGVKRVAYFLPATVKGSGPAPLVFEFHGHFGTALLAERQWGVRRAWPEANIITLQGLPTKTQRVDPQGRGNGWGWKPDGDGARDLAFVDATYKWAKDNGYINGKTYAMGHSNGAVFVYLLASQRTSYFNAFGAVAGIDVDFSGNQQPINLIHVAGKADTTVPFRGQELTFKRFLRIDGCDTGTEYAPLTTFYKGSTGKDVATYIYDGGHNYQKDATPVIVKFFKEH